MDPQRTRTILTLAAPIVGGMISQNVLNLVDTAMVGQVGSNALAGVGLASFAYFMSFAAITGLSSGVQAMAARRLGEDRPSEAAAALHEGLIAALVIGAPLMVALWFLAPSLFGLLTDDPAVVEHSVPYYRARLAAIVAVGANFAFRGFWNGVSRPGLYFRTLLTMHIANVPISYGLIFGMWGLPELGSLGAGVGTAIATWLGTITYITLALSHGGAFGFLKRSAAPDWASLRTLVRLSVPTAIQQFLFAAGFTTLFWIIGQVGTKELAAGNVLINVMLVGILPGMGLGLAAASLVGQALGRGQPADAKRWGWDVVKVGVIGMALIGLPMVLFPEAIIGVFLPTDPEALQVAKLPLQVVGATIAFDAVGLILLNALLGAGAARQVAVVAVGTQWVFMLPLAYLVGPVWGFGLVGIWVVQVTQRFMQAAIFAVIWERGRWVGIEV